MKPRSRRDRRPVVSGPVSHRRSAAGWEPVADWYAGHLREEGTLLRDVVYPGALRMLGPVRGKRILDVACGEGTFAALLAKAGAAVSGVDASPALIRSAEQKRIAHAAFRVGDVRHLETIGIAPASFDSAVMLMAIANIDSMELVFRGAAHFVKPHASFLLVLAHPCFRIPRQSGWGWDDARKLQYRRVDRYLTALDIPIQAHPGSAPHVRTRTFHRPLSTYVAALVAAGFAITALEEWTSDRASDSGPRMRAENLSRREIPVFLAIRAMRLIAT